jgi:hypothetical protein
MSDGGPPDGTEALTVPDAEGRVGELLQHLGRERIAVLVRAVERLADGHLPGRLLFLASVLRQLRGVEVFHREVLDGRLGAFQGRLAAGSRPHAERDPDGHVERDDRGEHRRLGARVE